jgi:hypothetical protein
VVVTSAVDISLSQSASLESAFDSYEDMYRYVEKTTDEIAQKILNQKDIDLSKKNPPDTEDKKLPGKLIVESQNKLSRLAFGRFRKLVQNKFPDEVENTILDQYWDSLVDPVFYEGEMVREVCLPPIKLKTMEFEGKICDFRGLDGICAGSCALFAILYNKTKNQFKSEQQHLRSVASEFIEGASPSATLLQKEYGFIPFYESKNCFKAFHLRQNKKETGNLIQNLDVGVYRIHIGNSSADGHCILLIKSQDGNISVFDPNNGLILLEKENFVESFFDIVQLTVEDGCDIDIEVYKIEDQRSEKFEKALEAKQISEYLSSHVGNHVLGSHKKLFPGIFVEKNEKLTLSIAICNIFSALYAFFIKLIALPFKLFNESIDKETEKLRLSDRVAAKLCPSDQMKYYANLWSAIL